MGALSISTAPIGRRSSGRGRSFACRTRLISGHHSAEMSASVSLKPSSRAAGPSFPTTTRARILLGCSQHPHRTASREKHQFSCALPIVPNHFMEDLTQGSCRLEEISSFVFQSGTWPLLDAQPLWKPNRFAPRIQSERRLESARISGVSGFGVWSRRILRRCFERTKSSWNPYNNELRSF